MSAPPGVPDEFWSTSAEMHAALLGRHMGRVLRAFRTHPFHGRHALSQELAAHWLATTQSQLSRYENGPRIERLDLLIHVARVLAIPQRYLWFQMPDDHREALSGSISGGNGTAARLARDSAARTEHLLDAVAGQSAGSLNYVPPVRTVQHVENFLESNKRVCLVTGLPGCGKSSLMLYLSKELVGTADVQLHFTDSWDLRETDLATEILRYASIEAHGNSLLALEQNTIDLARPLVVILDGVSSQARADDIGRQLDAALRQVTAAGLKFLMVIRTPPDVELSAHPILAASLYEVDPREPATSREVTAWGWAQAQAVWERSRSRSNPAYNELPMSVQLLARTPLYMRLLITAGYDDDGHDTLNAFRVIDHCVQSILRQGKQRADVVMRLLCELAELQDPDLVPAQLTGPNDPFDQASSSGSVTVDDLLPSVFVRRGPHGRVTFTHDVIREYFLATRLAQRIIDRGRSVAAVTALNELAARATESAVGRGVFDFIVYSLDVDNPALLAAVATAPSVSVTTTLPMMMRLASIENVAFASPEVLRACAARCSHRATLELSRVTLNARGIKEALGAEYFPWILSLLREFGAALWEDLAASLDGSLTSTDLTRLIATTDLVDPDEATFIARYFYLFFGDDESFLHSLGTLLGSTDWRVRSALAHALRDGRSRGNPLAGKIIGSLARDDDYKVRAAVGRSIRALDASLAWEHLAHLLDDDNWHVRGTTLAGLLADGIQTADRDGIADVAVQTVSRDPLWASAPSHVAALVQRLLLLHDRPSSAGQSVARNRAMFGILRELRTGWLHVSTALRKSLIDEGLNSTSWLVRREASAVPRDETGPPLDHHGKATAHELLSSEGFRRLRGQRTVQVALDLSDLAHAAEVAAAASGAGISFIEVGDPLIKEAGILAIETVKRSAADAIVVAEMMSSDWGRDQVVVAAEAGADVVLLIGPATAASVAAAVDAGRRFGVPLILDVPAAHANQRWVRDMERIGIDGFAITTNIDVGSATSHPLASAKALRAWTRLPVAVSGGFSATDRSVAASPDWDILIVGRAVAEATRPELAAKQLYDLIREGVQ
jgi:3-keto-L-gulonate-6-phosphate decarboxylase